MTPEETTEYVQQISDGIAGDMLDHFNHHMMKHNLDPLSATFVACRIFVTMVGYCDFALREGMEVTTELQVEFDSVVDELVKSCRADIETIRKQIRSD